MANLQSRGRQRIPKNDSLLRTQKQLAKSLGSHKPGSPVESLLSGRTLRSSAGETRGLAKEKKVEQLPDEVGELADLLERAL
jgi:hypothetical protein